MSAASQLSCRHSGCEEEIAENAEQLQVSSGKLQDKCKRNSPQKHKERKEKANLDSTSYISKTKSVG